MENFFSKMFESSSPQKAEDDKDGGEDISRRDFLEKAGKTVLVAVAAAGLGSVSKAEALGLFETLGPAGERFKEVKESTLLDLKSHQEKFEKEIGTENFNLLFAAVEHLDILELQKVIHEISGVPRQSLEKRPVRNLFILTEVDQKNMGGEEGQAHAAGETDKGTISIDLKSCLDEEGRFDEAVFQRIFIHEHNHVLTMDGESGELDWIPCSGGERASLDLYEGMTEMQTIKIIDRLKKERTDFYGYAGGNTLAAYYLDQVLDCRAVAASYYCGKLHGLEREMLRVFGPDSWDKLFFEKKRWVSKDLIPGVGAMNDLDLIFRLLKMSEEQGIDYKKILAGRAQHGVSEEVEVITNEETGELAGLINIKEVPGGGVMAKGMIVDSKHQDKYLPPIRFFLNPVKIAKDDLDKAGLFIGHELTEGDLSFLVLTFKRYKEEVGKYIRENAGRESAELTAEKIRNSFVNQVSFDAYICLPELCDLVIEYRKINDRQKKVEKKKEIRNLIGRVLKESIERLEVVKKKEGM